MSLFGLIKRPKSATRAVPATPVMRELPAEPAAVTPPQPGPSPTDIRQLLFDAIASGDESRLHWLCQEHRETIDRHAGEWMSAPDVLRTNPDAAEWYSRGVRLMMQFCTPTAA